VEWRDQPDAQSRRKVIKNAKWVLGFALVALYGYENPDLVESAGRFLDTLFVAAP